MWDDFKIGTGVAQTSATKVFSLPEGVAADISDNSTAFWISNAFCDAGGRIFKNTVEGKKLAELIEKGSSAPINTFLSKLVLMNITPAKLKRVIDEAINESFNRGREKAQDEMRHALGM